MLEATVVLGDDPMVPFLRDWVHQHFGIEFPLDQLDPFRYRVASLCDELGLDTQSLAARVTAGDVLLARRLADSVSTNYTYFFREPEVIELFRGTILPSLPRELRIWSAAAAGGDEAYTIAITCLEAMGEDAPVSILGTDISERQIRGAEAGVYPATHLEGLNQERLARHFTPAGLGLYGVVPSLRRMCTFRRLNLSLAPWPFEQRFHVIFLRNVLYYFDPPTRRQVVESCYDAIEPGGWLITSLTEPLHDVPTRWTRLHGALYRRDPA